MMMLALYVGLYCVLGGPPAAVPPLNDGQLERLRNDRALPDAEAGHRLVGLLVQRVAQWHGAGLPATRSEEGMDADAKWIVMSLQTRARLSGEVGAFYERLLADPALAPATPAGLRADGYLRIALFQAVPSERPANLAELLDTQHHAFFVGLILDAFRQGGVPVSALPALLGLTADPYCAEIVSDAQPNPRRLQYPLRRASAECLRKLGITCQVMRVRQAQGAADEDLWEELIVVDLGSLQRRLAEWKASPDPAMRDAAAQVAARIRIEPDPGNGRPDP